mmetsp:Transcript_27923/g.70042  ORF Transcript_27923/g.70042 Transcript_27923/m.70042 type:complete len:437 (-) Transcript_27923:91-1401(-)
MLPPLEVVFLYHTDEATGNHQVVTPPVHVVYEGESDPNPDEWEVGMIIDLGVEGEVKNIIVTEVETKVTSYQLDVVPNDRPVLHLSGAFPSWTAQEDGVGFQVPDGQREAAIATLLDELAQRNMLIKQTLQKCMDDSLFSDDWTSAPGEVHFSDSSTEASVHAARDLDSSESSHISPAFSQVEGSRAETKPRCPGDGDELSTCLTTPPPATPPPAGKEGTTAPPGITNSPRVTVFERLSAGDQLNCLGQLECRAQPWKDTLSPHTGPKTLPRMPVVPLSGRVSPWKILSQNGNGDDALLSPTKSPFAVQSPRNGGPCTNPYKHSEAARRRGDPVVSPSVHSSKRALFLDDDAANERACMYGPAAGSVRMGGADALAKPNSDVIKTQVEAIIQNAMSSIRDQIEHQIEQLTVAYSTTQDAGAKEGQQVTKRNSDGHE